MKKNTLKQPASWQTGLSLTVLCLIAAVNTVSAEDSGDAGRGVRAWANTCARCHNLRNASEFRDDLWQPIVNHMRIRAGIPGSMARDILAYLQSSNYAAPAPRTLVAVEGLSGEEVFSRTCVVCHGADGTGVLPGVPKLSERLSRSSDDVLSNRILNGFQSPGSTMAMPPKGGDLDLTDVDIKNVLSYIRSKFGN